MRVGSLKSREAGFSLVETLVAILIFSLMTLGTAPVILSSIRASTLSRSGTIGKNLAVEAMERVRGLPYYIEYSRQQQDTRADVLDFYFPSSSGTGYSTTNKTYTTTCTAGSTSGPACNLRLHPGYTVEFVARFVTPRGTPPNQTYETSDPGSTYNWRYDVATATPTDVPPSRLLEMTVTTRWQVGARNRTIVLKSYVGDRKFADISVLGETRIDYGVQVLTTYVDAEGRLTDLTVQGGAASSAVNQRLTSSSGQTLGTGRVLLVDRATGESLISTSSTRPSVAYNAPPDLTPAATTFGAVSFAHPRLSGVSIAGLDATRLQNSQVTVANEVPLSRGEYSYPAAGGSADDLWVNNQADPNGSLNLDRTTGRRMFTARTNAAGEGLLGRSRSQVFDSPSRYVESTATVNARDIQILPLTSGPTTGVVVVDSFTATVTCQARGSGTPVFSATWSASVRVWVERQLNGRQDGSYRTITLSNTSGTLSDALVAAGIDSNPVVWDAPQGRTNDIRLFQLGGTRGYLASWNNVPGTQSVESANRITNASIDGAIRIVTSPTTRSNASPSYPESGLKISLGKLSCRSEDRR